MTCLTTECPVSHKRGSSRLCKRKEEDKLGMRLWGARVSGGTAGGVALGMPVIHHTSPPTHPQVCTSSAALDVGAAPGSASASSALFPHPDLGL